jgi:hypothetical protein
VEAQQGKMGIKMLFRQGEMTTLLKSCTAGLDQALDVFMVNLISGSACELLNLMTTGRWSQCGQRYCGDE